MVEIAILRLEGFDAAVALPAYATDGAAGADLRANFAEGAREGIVLAPGARALVPTGLSMAIPEGFEVQIRPRSGLALKHGVTLVNAPGTIDSDYRGPVGVILVNLGAEAFHVAHGERIAQMVVAPVTRGGFVEVTSLGDTARGQGGLRLHRAGLMLTVLFLAAVLWFGGAWLGVSRGPRLAVVAVLFGFAVLAQVVLPEGHGLREMTGGTLARWLMFFGIVAVVLVYRAGLGVLKRRAQGAPEEEAPAGTFREVELERYARHIVLRELGGPGQKRLKEAKVLVIGAGGLGSPALLYLGAAGVGTLGVIDDDVVDNTNLQRQVIHMDAAIGTPKVFSAEKTVTAQNPHVTVKPYNRKLTGEIAEALFAEYDVILDGTDSFATRYLANRVAAAQGKPLVSGALSQWEGQVSVFDPAKGAPCYQCIFPEAPAPGLAPTCAEAGVLGPLPGVVGAMMAVEAVKVITGAGAALRGEMLIYDALWGETRKIALKRRADCPVCGVAHGEVRP